MERQDQALIRSYCESCESYITSKDYVGTHLDHNVTDLAEKTAHYLCEYQKLSRLASLLSERRQIHIKNESINDIIMDIKKDVLDIKDKIKEDIFKSIEDNADRLMDNHIVHEMSRVKKVLTKRDDEELIRTKNELAIYCKDLLVAISDDQYESADKMIDFEKYKVKIPMRRRNNPSAI